MKRIILITLFLIIITGCGMETPPPNINARGFNTYNTTPYNCTNQTEGNIFGHTIINSPCYCNGTDWISLKNFSQVCI